MADPKEPASPKASADRQPYEKPAVAWEEKLEDRPNLIAACAQRPAGGDECDANPFS